MIEISSTILLQEAAKQLNYDLASLVAKCCIWVPRHVHKECGNGSGNYAKIKNCRRKKNDEPKGKHDDLIYDDNTRPNYQMKAAIRQCYGIDLSKGDFTTCHVWPETCYDTRYHTCFANLVMIPAAIHSLSDFDKHVTDCLKYRAYELFGWKPDEEPVPLKPENYPTEWFQPEIENAGVGETHLAQEYDAEGRVFSKALSRLKLVYNSPTTTVHAAIQRALDAGCTVEQWISRLSITDSCVTNNTIASMKTESGNSYGKYFEGRGRADKSELRFTQEVWDELQRLGWSASPTV